MRVQAAVVAVTGLMFAALAVPLMRGRVPPNQWYGFRLARDVFEPVIWYPLNAYGGRLMLWWGVAIAAAALGLAVAPVKDDDTRAATSFGVVMGVLLGGALLITVLSYRELARLRREHGPDGGA